MMNPNTKRRLRTANSGVLSFLRIRSWTIALPAMEIYSTSAGNSGCVARTSRRSNLDV
jgi:hypothetical protein